MSKYPDCFPPDFEENILPSDATLIGFAVYRVCTEGIVNRKAFMSSFEKDAIECLCSLTIRDPLNPSTYSTSCWLTIKNIKKNLRLMQKHYPPSKIAKGITYPECGPSQITFERIGERKGHVDWWIYKDSKPHEHFELLTGVE